MKSFYKRKKSKLTFKTPSKQKERMKKADERIVMKDAITGRELSF